MTILEKILICLLCVLGAVCVILAALIIKRRRDDERLVKSIENYLDFGTKIDFSVADNHFSHLQNAVHDMEYRVDTEKHNYAREAERSAQFIADVSHQLKTPIAAMKLYCEMDLAAGTDPHAQKKLELAEKTEELVYKLLRLEKIRADAYIMTFLPCSARELAESVCRRFEEIYPDKNFAVNGDADFRCDREWLGEALANVVKNACEHTASDGIVAINIDGGDASTMLEVCDNGGGVEESELAGLFVRFYKRANSSPNNTGIGLAITKAIVEKHHGIVTAQNKYGGLCVQLVIPHINAVKNI